MLLPVIQAFMTHSSFPAILFYFLVFTSFGPDYIHSVYLPLRSRHMGEMLDKRLRPGNAFRWKMLLGKLGVCQWTPHFLDLFNADVTGDVTKCPAVKFRD